MKQNTYALNNGILLFLFYKGINDILSLTGLEVLLVVKESCFGWITAATVPITVTMQLS